MNTNIISGLINCTTTRNQRCTVGCPTCGALSYSNIGGKQAPFVNASGFSQCSEDRGLRRLDNLRYISRCSISLPNKNVVDKLGDKMYLSHIKTNTVLRPLRS